jgi:hypothetical protein
MEQPIANQSGGTKPAKDQNTQELIPEKGKYYHLSFVRLKREWQITFINHKAKTVNVSWGRMKYKDVKWSDLKPITA